MDVKHTDALIEPKLVRSSAAYRSPYRPDIDGLRAVAILAVVGFHAFPRMLPGGFVGVDVFFVISGFLITGIILRELAAGNFSYLTFYERRAKRLFPALAVLLASVAVLGWMVLLPDEFRLLGMHTAAGSGFALNLVLYRDFSRYFEITTQPLLHLWSLAVEEQFYLLWPLTLAAICLLARGRLALLVSIAVLSFGVNLASPPPAMFYLPWTRLWELAVGGILAYAQLRAAAKLPATLQGVVGSHARGIVGAGMLIAAFILLKSEYLPGWVMLLPVSGAILIISAGTDGWINRFVLSTRAMVLIGLISYPLYLWHWPLLTFARVVGWGHFTVAATVAAIGVSFVAATLSYRYIELPLRSSRRHATVALASSIAVILCGATGYLMFIRHIPARPLDAPVERLVTAATEEWPPRNVDWDHVDRLLLLGNGALKVLFIGDSNLFEYYSRIEQLMLEHPDNPHGAVLAARSGCALGAIEIERFPECRAYLEKAVEYAKRPEVDRIVIAAAWFNHFARYKNDSDHFGEPAPLRTQTDRALGSLQKTVTDFVTAGKRVYIVLQTPLGASLDPRRQIQRTVLPPGFTLLARSLPTDTVLRSIEPINAKLRKLAQDTGARVIDPMESLCPDSTCPATTPAGEPMYYDASHVLPSYARSHVKYLDQTLLEGLPGEK